MASPDERSICIYCGFAIERWGDGRWTAGQLAGLSRNPECSKAPNPDDGPMPDHEPGVIAKRPAW